MNARSLVALAMVAAGCREDAFDRPTRVAPDLPDVAPAASLASRDAALPEPDAAELSELAAMEDAPSPKSSAPSGESSVSPLRAAAGSTLTAKWTSDAQGVIARNRWRFRACHAKALALDATAAGKIVLTVKIKPEGEVTSCVVRSTTAPPALASCVARTFESMKFAEPETGATTIEVPVDLVLKK